MTLLTLLHPRRRPTADAEAEAIARRLGWPQHALHYLYQLPVYPPTPDEDRYLLVLRNPDTGIVDFALGASAAEALRLLADSLDDDL